MATIPTISEIKNQILSDIESETGKDAPLLPVSVWEILATAIAGALYLFYKYSDWVRKQIFVLSADEEAVVARGAEYGLFQIAAQIFIGTAEATGVDGTEIPVGKLYTKGPFVYQNTELATIEAGIASLTLEAVDTGEGPSLSVDDTLEEVSPTAGLDSSVTITEIVQTGVDEEDIEAFRNRIDFRQKTPPQGGSAPDYIQWATEVPGIAEAFPFLASPGFVNIYPLTNDPDPVNRIPDSTKLSEVTAYCSDIRRRPLNSNVSAQAFTEFEVDVAVTGLVPNTADIRSKITTEIENYLYSRRPLVFPDDANPKNSVSKSDIVTIAGLAGGRSFDLTISSSGKSFPYTLLDNELPKPGDITFS